MFISAMRYFTEECAYSESLRLWAGHCERPEGYGGAICAVRACSHDLNAALV